MANAQHYDAIVIGSGQAGTPLSKALAQAGRSEKTVSWTSTIGDRRRVAGMTSSTAIAIDADSVLPIFCKATCSRVMFRPTTVYGSSSDGGQAVAGNAPPGSQ